MTMRLICVRQWRGNTARKYVLFLLCFFLTTSTEVRSTKGCLQNKEATWKMPTCSRCPGVSTSGNKVRTLTDGPLHSLLPGLSICGWEAKEEQVQSHHSSGAVCVLTFCFYTCKAARSEHSLVSRVCKWHTFDFCLFWQSLPVVFLYIAKCSACIFFLRYHMFIQKFPSIPLTQPGQRSYSKFKSLLKLWDSSQNINIWFIKVIKFLHIIKCSVEICLIITAE